jgi:hypothetical protein
MAIPVDPSKPHPTGRHQSASQSTSSLAFRQTRFQCVDCKGQFTRKEVKVTYVDGDRTRCILCHASWHQRQKRKRSDGFARILVSKIKDRCRLEGIPFDLDQHRDAFIKRVIAFRCEISGMKLRFGGKRGFDSLSVDRINPKVGYLYSNIRIICLALNTAFGDWGEDCFRDVAEAWLKTTSGNGSPKCHPTE